MAPTLAEWTAGGVFPAILATSFLAAATCSLALCVLCKRKENKRVPVQDEESLVGAGLLRQIELSPLTGSVSNLPKLKRANSRGKDQSPARVSVPYEDDGTASSCSFIILPQREVPQPPSPNPLSPEETYSNLTFPKRAPEVFYESIAVKDEAPEETLVIPEKEAGGAKEEKAVEAEYAHVLKGKKKNNQGGPEVGGSQTPQDPCGGGTVLTPVQVQEMYSVVCKSKRKTVKNCMGSSEERTPEIKAGQGNGHLVAVDDQEPDARPGHRSSPSKPPVIEPWYESVSCGSWVHAGRKETKEPAYETIDAHWETSKRKERLKKKVPAENLYESIENLAFQCQIRNTASRFEL